MSSIGWYGERAKSVDKKPSDAPFSHWTKVAILFGGIVLSGALFSGISFTVFKLLLG